MASRAQGSISVRRHARGVLAAKPGRYLKSQAVIRDSKPRRTRRVDERSESTAPSGRTEGRNPRWWMTAPITAGGLPTPPRKAPHPPYVDAGSINPMSEARSTDGAACGLRYACEAYIDALHLSIARHLGLPSIATADAVMADAAADIGLAVVRF